MAGVAIGARSYVTNAYLNNKPAVALGILKRPGSNALAPAEEVLGVVEDLSRDFPPGLEYQVVYSPKELIEASVNAVYLTLFELVLLVVVVIIVVLQRWRTALSLTIWTVVEIALVLVENLAWNMESGMSPRDATARTMDQIQNAIIGTTPVRIAVFVPAAFVPGFTGQLYRQFAVTISVATVNSTMNSPSLSPVLAAPILKPATMAPSSNPLTAITSRLADGFKRAFDALAAGYGRAVRSLMRTAGMLGRCTLVFAGVLEGDLLREYASANPVHSGS